MRLTRMMGLLAVAGMLTAGNAQAAMFISEWMYNGLSAGGAGEYIEFTNAGGSPIDMTGWSFDDDSRTPGVVSLSSFGVVAPGESVLLTEASATAFRSDWSLPGTVKIVGDNAANLGRSDEINLFDNLGALADRLTYSDQNIPGSVRTQNISGNPGTPAALGMNNVAQWVLSTSGDQIGSRVSASGDIGNPGNNVPEPTSLMMLVFGCAGALIGCRRIAR